ncbi:DUF2235 domain-containing protein [Yoonia sediminilitoris]|uniref:Uncharacterized protein (DUF2235 family) n=1 Tax=Yoonia sediminilitoris TaxID=1286148 RepID=A0A2T6KDV4_9RHOB|nr:DUF2235 domain-containing protein [Yoonia sediminilitoris]PUB13193.1 uncharacterized protein (DUF2235 family) [Yoonia sediminilitoris]RCW94528.1 uncharacterized protein (DUF2235 family) [Yoonia sediminilitoris]
MKRIALFIDGTWNRPDALNPTNVVRLSRCVKPYDIAGRPQQVIYSPGVGAGRGNTWLGRKMDRILGGALGWGLTDIIQEAYRNLVFAYQPGDEIYIFGFSRGAFAARSLAGLIRSSGIPSRAKLDQIPVAMARYVDSDHRPHPDDPVSFHFRKDFAPRTATSEKELNWRRAQGQTDAIRLKIAYVGVWDTVKALGIPAFLPGARVFNAQYRFHDADLSSSVKSARHAISTDERRITFPASPWENIGVLNRDAGVGDDKVQPYAQQWFPGDHGSVGGGGARIGLSSVALHWIAQGAALAQLDIDWPEFDKVANRFAPHIDKLTNKFGPAGVSGAMLNTIKKERDGPKELENLSVAALDRLLHDPGYRPETLNFVRDDLRDQPQTKTAAIRDWLVARDGGPTHELDSTMRPRPWDLPRNAPLASDAESA